MQPLRVSRLSSYLHYIVRRCSLTRVWPQGRTGLFYQKSPLLLQVPLVTCNPNLQVVITGMHASPVPQPDQTANRGRAGVARGVQGHAPPREILNFSLSEMRFAAYQLRRWSHVCIQHSLGLPLRMNEKQKMQFDCLCFDLLPLVI